MILKNDEIKQHSTFKNEISCYTGFVLGIVGLQPEPEDRELLDQSRGCFQRSL